MTDQYREITQEDVGRTRFSAFGRTWRTGDFIGNITSLDVGKRVFLRGGILQVENEEQRAARLARPPELQLPSGFEDYARAACYALTSSGLIVNFSRQSVSYDGAVHEFSVEERRRAWCWDSLLTGFRAFERGDVVLALRCLLQVAEYAGHLGSFPGPLASDGYSALKTAIERHIGGPQ